MIVSDYINFPDMQLHLKFNLSGMLVKPNGVVSCRIRDMDDIGRLYLLKNLFDQNNICLWKLNIFWLMGARWDRPINEKQESFDLKVFADFINGIGAKTVEILDPHSYASLAAIDNARAMEYQRNLYERFPENKNKLLVIPDAGAQKKGFDFLMWQQKTEHLQCLKSRKGEQVNIDLYSPNINLNHGSLIEGKDLIIVDDICDGGATFIAIAKKLAPYKPKSLSLMVTHGIFSKGFGELCNYFQHIYTTNSFRDFNKGSTHQFLSPFLELSLNNYTSRLEVYDALPGTQVNVYQIFKPTGEDSNECFIVDRRI